MAWLKLNLTTDMYPEETHWNLTNKCTGEVIDTVGGYTDEYAIHKYRYCVTPDKYEFVIMDSSGDGYVHNNSRSIHYEFLYCATLTSPSPYLYH